MNKRAFVITIIVLNVVLIMQSLSSIPGSVTAAETIQFPDLHGDVRVVRDSDYIPHIFAKDDHDAYLVLGYIHAQDRFFQMDMQRRLFSGQLAELIGGAALTSDIRFRTYGLRRAAEASMSAYSPGIQAIFSAYAGGVNAYLTQMKKKRDLVPPEYGFLELTPASILEWTPIDTIVIAKGMAFQLSFDLVDIALTRNLAAFERAGKAGGYDGRKLFFEDVLWFTPFDPTVTQPIDKRVKWPLKSEKSSTKTEVKRHLAESIQSHTLRLADQYLEGIKPIPFLQRFLNREESLSGSNWWVVSGKHTVSGYPILANDPHLNLDMPSVFYEAHLIVEADTKLGPMNVNGVSVVGIPAILLGCNNRLCWGSSTNPSDVTDIYEEQLVEDSRTIFRATIFENKEEPLTVIEQKYAVNKVGDFKLDNVEPAKVEPDKGGITWIVPRRNNGPIIEVERRDSKSYGLSIQYLGWGATREIEAFHSWARAKNLEDFKGGLRFYDVGSQNMVVADINGNIAYYTSAKVPLREDLQNFGRPDGDIPPYMIRDGTHRLKHEWLRVEKHQLQQTIDFQTLPFSEMPQIVNPKQGFIANANNDPLGTTIDNDPVNQFRKGGGVYYLNQSYHTGIRMGRIMRLLQDKISNGNKISVDDMIAFQSDIQMFDSEILTPYILRAFNHAKAKDAPAALASVAANPGLAQAVDRLRDWDFTAPAGIPQRIDLGGGSYKLAEPLSKEIQSSVNATIYALWRSRMVDNVIDATLRRIGVGNHRPGNGASISLLKHLLENFKTRSGVGVSGVKFIDFKDGEAPETALDIVILRSLQEALNLLASDDFAPAFKKSTDQNEYRWGRLHRVVFNHRLGKRFSIPNTAGPTELSSELQGIARSGGFEALDGSGHNVRAASVNSFIHSNGAARRFIGELTPQGPQAFQIIPGGENGDFRSRFYTNMLERWLTYQFHQMLLTRNQVEAGKVSDQRFEPAR